LQNGDDTFEFIRVELSGTRERKEREGEDQFEGFEDSRRWFIGLPDLSRLDWKVDESRICGVET